MDSTFQSKEVDAYEQDNMEHDEENHNASAKSGAKYRASIHHQGIYTEGPEKMFSLTSNDSSDEKQESFSPQQYETNTVTADHHQPDKAENRGTELSSTLIEPFQEDEICGMKKKYYGTKSDKKEKVIILVGATGSGKTTLVNFIANYFQGNKKADGELVHVARCSNDDHSFTKTITAYTFCDHQDHTPITVIDTPGLDDSSGAEIRDHVLSIKTFLANIASHDYEIHAIGFVAQAHLVRLTSSERLVMNHVSTLFGEASGDHILTFITFGDSQSNPPIVEAMAYYGVKCKLFLRFNNSILTMKTGDEIDELDQIYWNMGSKSWKKCMKVLEEMPPLSVHTMKTLQHSVYVSQIYDSVKKNLKSELKAFINTTNIHKGMMNKDAINVCESVWQLAIVVNYHSNKQSNKTHFVDTLLHYTKEVCQEARANEYNCVKLLSLAPSRELVNKGVGILEYNAPVYNIFLQQQHNYAEKPPLTGRSISLYCKNCKDIHQLKRKDESQYSYSSKDLNVTYTCSSCQCEGNVHTDDQRYFDTQKPKTWSLIKKASDWFHDKAKTDSRELVVELTHNCILQLAQSNVSQTIKDNSISRFYQLKLRVTE
ncbi:hypothetical protein Pmani_027918 [Petrolisthes manimaculis]|uniref:AIG1-type G domain-containing protein n=1 Tax=Petrolisthes manimaculis TaxID=1843537 RepID=A0AAE1P351_9EUCA|nr:hypothetical protein Pmani_027918 [Petrolisthes manimaculis]